MSRIQKKFKEIHKRGEKALIPFIVAGDPTIQETKKIILSLAAAGADIIELGVPFSDPMADGVVIQKAYERALKNKITLKDIFKLVREVRKESQVPLLLMGYYNPIFLMGHEKFAAEAKAAGVDAVLVVDLPPEEAAPFRQILKKTGIDFVVLLTPTSDEKRIQKALRLTSGFVYYVSLTGVTGANLKVGAIHELPLQIASIRSQTSLPLAVGFGISTPDQAARVAGLADGVVVGSALVKLIAASPRADLHKKVQKFIHSLKSAICR